MITDPRSVIQRGPMTRFQNIAVVICIALNMLDGFDVLVVAFASSSIAADWNLSGAQLGILLSAGLVGMAGGSLFVAPYADHYGRRTIILLCLGILTTGMLASSLAQGLLQLTVLRVYTGLGIGGMLASIGVITAEYSSDKWRSMNVSLQTTGYPLGATLGGVVAAYLIAHYGWRAAFCFGGLVSAAMFPIVIRSLPESMDFLLARRPDRALERVNDLLQRMGREAIAELPPLSTNERPHTGAVRALFGVEIARSTLLIWSSFFLLMFAFYFIMSWTPRLLVSAGMSAQEGITGGVLLNVGGIAGGAAFAWFSSQLSLRPLTYVYLASAAVCTVLFGLFATSLTTAFLLAVGIGVFLLGSMAGLYSLAPILYSAPMRATGMGWAIGIGRMGAILAPLVTGLLVDAGWTAKNLYVVFAVCLVGAVFTVRAIRAG